MTQTTDMLKVQLGAAADSKSRTLLKTTRAAVQPMMQPTANVSGRQHTNTRTSHGDLGIRPA